MNFGGTHREVAHGHPLEQGLQQGLVHVHMVWVPTSNILVLYGGDDGQSFLNDVWKYNNGWTQAVNEC